MILLFLSYLAFGIIVTFWGPLSEKVNSELSNIKTPSISVALLNKKPIPKRKILLVEIVIRILVFLFYPFWYLIIFIEFRRSKSIKKVEKVEFKRDNSLYFSRIGGVGDIACKKCFHSEEVIGFLHGTTQSDDDSPSTEDSEWEKTGFQCQKCGKFHSIHCDMSNSKNKKCECGGDLKRDKPLFCPRCNSFDVSYSMNFIM